MGIYKFCGNRDQYEICIIGLEAMDAPAILPFPSHMPSQTCSHTTCILYPITLPFPSSSHTSRLPPFHLPLPPFASPAAPPLMPPSPNILPSSSLSIPFPIPYSSPPVSLSSSFQPDTAPPLLSPCVSSEAIGSYLINHFPPIPDFLPLSFQIHSKSH